ncbi:SGNH/GDSL hydrolase family protein [Nocardia sp. bgisy118]|uniref:SGNH/GDSL hydrolase family protein n=1 Tax=Nocardia sp. bgisy118 TaxID=3413786 RepID=UPI003F49BB4C
MLGTTRTLLAAAAVAILPLTAVTGLATESAAADRTYSEYVALGDSWAADVTGSQITTQFTPVHCLQSARNYPKQVAAALSTPVFRDATCGGAETKHMTSPQTTALGSNPPQFDSLTSATDLVTLGIGGNDAALAKSVFTCLTTDPAATPCLDTMITGDTDVMTEAIDVTATRVTATIVGIRARAPHARILLLDYFEAVGTTGGCFPEIPISDADAIWLGNKLIELNDMLTRIAAATGVEFVDTYTGSTGHDACQPPGVRWVEGLVPFSSTPVGPAAPFHPNQLGADYQARRVLETLGA